jgi:hypothetical protein
LKKFGAKRTDVAGVDCPTGNHRNTCPAPFAKIFRFTSEANHLFILAIPAHTERRFAIVTDVGQGCGGREVAR